MDRFRNKGGMNYTVLGCLIEYDQAAKRLEEIMDAPPGTPEAKERKFLIQLFINYEKDLKKIRYRTAQLN